MEGWDRDFTSHLALVFFGMYYHVEGKAVMGRGKKGNTFSMSISPVGYNGF